MAETPTIPETITVHLGRPDDASAQNVIVSFPDYIKNVASSEIYPTWPDNAIRANIYAQISYALNRVYTEWYRSQGYNFDITNSTAYDQYFVKGRDTFENIDAIVDDIFNDYVVRQGSVEPLFTQYCNGTTVQCEGLSQWGSVDLANQGLTPYEILQYYYGNDINLVKDAEITANIPSYPGTALRLGMASNQVKDLQVRLNRISTNYPAIAKIYPVDGIFGPETEQAVKDFQKLFRLTVDGVVGKATWYRVMYLYNAVKRLSELDSEGLRLEEISNQFPSELKLGDRSTSVAVLQYYLSVLSDYYDDISNLAIDGMFGPETQNAVIALQKSVGLPETGVVDRETWKIIYDRYKGIIQTQQFQQAARGVVLFPGVTLKKGSTGSEVEIFQQYLSFIADTYTQIPKIPITGYFGDQTEQAVIALQNLFGIPPTGTVGPITWDITASLYSDLSSGLETAPEQYPGYILTERR